MTEHIAFTTYVDSETIANECANNPALLAEILHFVAKGDGLAVSYTAQEASREAASVYNADAITAFLRSMADQITATQES